MRRSLLVAAALVFACTMWPVASAEEWNPVVTARAIPLYPNRPNDRQAGRLIYRGGLELTAKDASIGGLSDLIVSADGTRVLMISDTAHWFRARLSYDAKGDLAGLTDADVAPMRDLLGNEMHGKEGDAEGMTAETPGDPSAGVLVSFERDHRVWRYDLSQGLAAKPMPVAMGSWIDDLPSNGGLEAIALVQHDTLLAFAESERDDKDDIIGALEAYPMQVGHGGFGPLTARIPEPYAITSAAADGDGGVFILERRFSFLGGLGMQVRHVPRTEIRPGARLVGTVLVTLGLGDANVDNMEGIAVRRDAQGRTFIYLVSDDNFSPLQRTVLLMFELAQ